MEPFIAQIMMFGGNFAPRGWAFCDGQLLPINQYSALFSLLGTTYGGDGRTTFALPDLRGRAPIHVGVGPGLTPVKGGERIGAEKTTLSIVNLPAHNHIGTVNRIVANGEATIAIPASTNPGNETEPADSVVLAVAENASNGDEVNVYSNTAANTTLKSFTAPIALNGTAGEVNIGLTGGSIPFNNMQPSLGINYIIALEGLFPSRS